MDSPPNSCAPSYTPKCLEFSGLVSWKSLTTQNSSSSTLPVPSLFQLVTEDETSNVNSPALTTRCWQFETEIVGLTGAHLADRRLRGSRPCSRAQCCIVSINTGHTQKERATSPQTAFQGIAQWMASYQLPHVQGAGQFLSPKYLNCFWPGQCIPLFTKTSPRQPKKALQFISSPAF